MPSRKVMQKYEKTLESILAMFERDETMVNTIRFAMIQPAEGDNRPCSNWSFMNKLFMILAGTMDARGFRQWQKAGRQVKKGTKAFYILAPLTKIVKAKEICEETGEDREIKRTFINGFKFVPVFRIEDTEGDAIPTYDYSPPEPPPLYTVAEKMGIEVGYTTGENCSGAAGFFQWGKAGKKIVLATHDIGVFFHELAHAAHHKTGRSENRSKPEKEAVAETVAAVLARTYGHEKYNSQTWQYIKAFLGQDAKKALTQIIKLLDDIKEVLATIFEGTKEENYA